MSIRLMTLVWDHAPVSGSKLNVLLILADHSNDEGRCWPSMQRIAHRARKSERQTQRIIRGLEQEGLVRVEERTQQTSLYTVLIGGVTGGVTPMSGVTFEAGRGDIAVSPEPPIEPPIGVVVEKEPSLTRSQERPTATEMERAALDRVWAYWLQVSSKRQRLDDKRKRIIRNALSIMRATHDCSPDEAEQLVKRALLGVARSPHHNGQNEQRRTYLEIRYALKGIGDESDDERIEKAISWAAMYGGQQQRSDPAKVERWLEEVRYTLGQPHRPERERGQAAYRKLQTAGFKVERLDRPPWARISR